MSTNITDSLWRSGNLSYKLHGKQKEIYSVLRSNEGDLTILASRRFGKSFLMAVFASEEAIRLPNSKIIILAPSKAQAYEIYTPIMKALSADAPRGLVRPTKSEAKWTVGTSELIFAGFDTVAEALRGKGSVLVIFDEVGFVNADDYEYVMKSIIFPILQKTIGKKAGRKMWISTPAPAPNHPFNLHWEAEERKGKLHRYTIYDNPILTEVDIKAIIDEQGGEDSVGFRREYLCQNVRDTGGLIIPKFNKAKHVLDARKGIDIFPTTWLVGDTGGLRDKTVLHILGRLIQNRKIVILAEAVHDPNTDTVTIGDDIERLQGLHLVRDWHRWVDAHGQTRVDFYKLCGLSLPAPPKQDQDSAVTALNAAFYRDEIFVSSDCPFTIESLENCSFNKTRTDFLRTEKYGHADAIMTGVYGWRVAPLVTEEFRAPTRVTLQDAINLRKVEDLYRKVSEKLNPRQLVWRK